MFFYFGLCQGQNVTVKAYFGNIQSEKIYVLCESQKGKMLLDSATVLNNSFNFAINTKNYTGFIYLQGQKDFTNNPFIFYIDCNQKDTLFISSPSTINLDSLRFINSESNQLYYEGINSLNQNRFKLYFLQGVLNNYPFKDIVYQTNTLLKNKILKKFKKDNQKIRSKFKKSPTLANYFEIHEELFFDDYFHQSDYSKLKYWLLKINNDTNLLNTDILEHVFNKFTTTVYNDSITQLKMERLLQDSFYSLISSISINNKLLNKVGGMYLYFATQKTYYEAITDYIKKVQSQDLKIPFEKPKLVVGEKIKTIRGTSQSGYLVDINDFKSEYKLVLIWSPQCEHCLKTIKELDELYLNVKKGTIEFYSFSVLKLDSSFRNVFTWSKSASIHKGWENEFLTKYRINYTPLMLILNKDNVIIDIPSDVEKLSMVLGKLRLLQSEESKKRF
ncbi:MAG: thioredoxin-like domain-containing protein [Bacteroidota bacterium]